MITLLVINLSIFAFVFRLLGKFLKENDYLMLMQLGIFEAAWAGFLFMFCLIHFFNIMEFMGDGKTLLAVAGKERMVQVFVLLGFGIIHSSTFILIVAKLLNKRSV